MAATDLSIQPISPDMQAALTRLGIKTFRPGQRQVIESVLAGEDALCIMPTGGGKSLCYQLPSVLRDGLTIVVSPLIALMKDQVDSLRRHGIQAEFINSSISPQEQSACLDRLGRGECRLLYVAPERFRSQRFVEAVRRVRVQLLAVDEAHCISEWGHDFRHDYTRLGSYRARIGNPTTIALTATATPDVREDIVAQLKLDSPKVFVAGFARDNLHYSVQVCSSKTDKNDRLVRFLRKVEGAGIIYVSSRKACGLVAESLRSATRRKIGIYHAGLESHERRDVQDRFMSDETPVIVATNAFGMGIDKANVRFVVHYNIPGTIEAYYQEAGRAGRDGVPAECVLLFSSQDKYIQEYFIESAYPERRVVKQVYDYLKSQEDDPVQITQQELRERLGLEISTEGVGTCERLLERASAIERMDPHRNMAVVRVNSDVESLVDVLPKNAKMQRKVMSAVQTIVGDDRHEPIYVQPSTIAEKTNVALTAVTRALRELSQLECFDYIPPFRGRAIHVPPPAPDFESLQLDFETLALRKREDYAKLDKMIRYARGGVCRQMAILQYFGDPAAAPCGHCDSCGSDSDGILVGSKDAAMDAGVRRVIRIALSGIARAKAKFGKQLVAAMLGGSHSAKVTRWKLDKLSTFAMLDYLTQVEISRLLDALIEAGYARLSEVDRFRPVIELTDTGVARMVDDEADVTIHLPEYLMRKILGHEERLDRRQPRESEQIDPPGPTCAPNSRVPADANEGLERRLDTGHSGLDHGSDHGSDGVEEHVWTWRLLEAGFPVDACAAIRRLARSTILGHLQQAHAAGRPVEWTSLFNDARANEIDQVLSSHHGQSVRSLLSHLSFDLDESEVLLLEQTTGRAKTDHSSV
jgi:ATP-dependent DNA helicase RecQ